MDCWRISWHGDLSVALRRRQEDGQDGTHPAEPAGVAGEQQRWESIPEEARQAFIEVLADLMIRVAAREQDDDGTDHG